MTEVFLMRHGEAEPRAQTDAQRRLTERGLLQVRANASKLTHAGPIVILHSPLVRAQQSAETIQPYVDCVSMQTVDWLFPDTPVLTAVAELMSLSAPSVLLVSHNPLLDDLIAELTGQPIGTLTFETGRLHQVSLGRE